MEIIQTIWNTLTSENEILEIILSLIFSAIEIYLYTLISTSLLHIVISNKRRFMLVGLLTIIGAVTSIFIPAPYYSFVNLLFTVILSSVLFKTSLVKSIYVSLCFTVITFFVTIIWLSIFTLIFNCTAEYLQQFIIYRIILSIFIYFSYFLFYILCKKLTFNLSTLFEQYKNHKILFFNIFAGLITVLVELLIAYLYYDYIPLYLNVISAFIVLVYFFISIISLYRTSKLEVTTQLLETEKLYNKTLTTLHDNIRGFKHDFNNIVQAIGGYISSNNMDGLKTYYKDLMGDCQINNNLSVLNPEIINNPAIYSLLTDKYYKAEKLDIKFNIEILDDISNLNIKMYELARILGILLDNAIEASAKTDNKIVNVVFRMDKKLNRHLIIVENTYLNKNINIDKIFEKGYTSKNTEDKKSHGLGLWEVRKYLKKHNSFNLHTTKNDTYFTQQFEIYN